METALDAVVRAFFQSNRRLAVFDVEARELASQWELVEPIPVGDILDEVAGHEALSDGTKVILPLHEEASAELTGEYVLYDRGDGVFQFFDYSRESLRVVPEDAFPETFPATRLRFWHPAYSPPATPSYLEEFTMDPASLQLDSGASTTETQIDPDAFASELRLFVEREREAERATRLDEYEQKSLQAYVDTYGGIRSLAPAGRRVDQDGSQICMLEIDADLLEEEAEAGLDTFGLHRGAEVLIDTRTELPGFPVQAELVDVTGRQLDLEVKWTTSESHSAAEAAFDTDSDHRFQVVELLNPVPYNRLLDGIEAIDDAPRKRELIAGDAELAFDQSVEVRHFSRGLNQYQEGALRNAVGAEDVFCIHGPPGTGKSRTLTAVIRAAVQQGDRVLACAHSNQAIDQLLVGGSTPDDVDRHSLHAAVRDGEFTMARAGANSEHPVVTGEYTDVEFWEADVVGATASATHQFRRDEFDLVVMDEASQATIPATLLPWSRGDRLVLAGDPKQLPPYTSHETAAEETMEISLLEHFMEIYGENIVTVLRKQYRMNEAIAAFPNAEFYDGRLTHGQRNRDWQVRTLAPFEGIHVRGSEEQSPAGSYYNEAEAVLVRREIQRLREHAVVPERIGVITPYSAQVGKIVQAIDDEALADRVKVSTVDAFQGSERDAVIVSFVRSNQTGNIGFLGFPTEGPRRLNVALTRAKKRCVLIGDWETLAADAVATPVYRHLRDYLQNKNLLRLPA